jgi:hypothetical protein
MKQPLLLLLLMSFLVAGFTNDTPKAKDYLNVPGPVSFNNTDFHLAWSSNPNATYYKQEYIPSGETVEKYNQMLLLEVVIGKLTVEDAVRAQVNLIQQRKKTDKAVQYQVIENPATGEVILDFIMSAGDKKEVSMVEWNAYRYKPYKDESGRGGIMLFAISKRGYKESLASFFASLKEERIKLINLLGAHELPVVTIL